MDSSGSVAKRKSSTSSNQVSFKSKFKYPDDGKFIIRGIEPNPMILGSYVIRFEDTFNKEIYEATLYSLPLTDTKGIQLKLHYIYYLNNELPDYYKEPDSIKVKASKVKIGSKL